MFSRHELVWLTTQGWDVARAGAPEEQHPALLAWRNGNWPAVVRRHESGLPDDVVCLGLPLPLSRGVRQRLALVTPLNHVARRCPALPIGDTLGAAPRQWRATLAALQRDFAALDLRVYGSLAMASLTGQSYLRPQSDIDLLLRPASTGELHVGLALLAHYAALLPLDGEIVFPSDEAVSWKEWLAAQRDGARVLVKSRGAVRLAAPSLLEASLA
jgi:phosphoribosyl-dephospho-CoA transferase